MSNELESVNLLVLLYRWRKPIIIISAAAAVLSAVVSFVIKEKYKSTVVMFATQQHSFGEQLLEQVKKEDVLAYGEEEDAERLLQLINSEQIRNKIIDKYNLWEVYEIAKTDRGANTLIGKEYNENVTARLTKFGSIEVEVMDESPERARDMANDIAAYADTVSNKMRTDRALEAFQYAQSSLQNLESDVRLLEDSMKRLQEIGVYSYVDQIAALTDQYGTALAEGHPDRAQQIKDQMNFLSRYGATYTRIEKILDEDYEKLGIVKKRYDLMKIDIATKLPSKFIVDSASAADKKSYPIRWLIVAMSTASAFIFTFITMLLMDNFKRLRQEGRI